MDNDGTTNTNMNFIPDDKLFSHSERVSGRVVIITGAFEWSSGVRKACSSRNFRCCKWDRQRDCFAVRSVWVSAPPHRHPHSENVSHSAKVVIDLDVVNGKNVVTEIKSKNWYGLLLQTTFRLCSKHLYAGLHRSSNAMSQTGTTRWQCSNSQ